MLVTLDWFESSWAAWTGVTRQLKALAQGNPDRHGFEGLGWDVHVEGAGAELAVAKHLDRYWAGHVNVFSQADLGAKVQVRLRTKHHYDLIVRDEDSDDHAFILVTGQMPNYTVHGWIWGREAKQPQWRQTYGNRPAAYFVPKTALAPLKP